MVKRLDIVQVAFIPGGRHGPKRFRVELHGDHEDDRFEAWLEFAQAKGLLHDLLKQVRLAAQSA
jgi:hypothetical protein